MVDLRDFLVWELVLQGDRCLQGQSRHAKVAADSIVLYPSQVVLRPLDSCVRQQFSLIPGPPLFGISVRLLPFQQVHNLFRNWDPYLATLVAPVGWTSPVVKGFFRDIVPHSISKT